ncbi:MAG: protein-glutamate O-methyltransferase [Deltaproteobacteria bacterium]|nr:protein-glutamate O-methyltransferase [Deltaproteobacteria bacterium]
MKDPLQTVHIKDREFNLLSDLVYQTIGINLGPAKKELLRTRLGKRLRLLGIPTFKAYYKYVTEENKDELTNLFDAISTNLTSFFREQKHFDFLTETVLPEIMAEGKRRGDWTLRVWSAACSTGEEPYSLAITLAEYLGESSKWGVKILATDINTEVLEKARHGEYKEARVADLSKIMKRKYFLCGEGRKAGMVKVKRELRHMVTFRRLNLTIPRYPFRKEFDFIFCRNVMIYFDKFTQKQIIDRVYRHLKKGGYLFLGHAESLTGIETDFKYIQPTIYKKI